MMKKSATSTTAASSSRSSGSSSASSSAGAAGSSPTSSAQPHQEYPVRVPKKTPKPISIMRFNGALGVDPSKWTSLKMAREDNSKTHKTTFIPEDDNMPKFGAGSEYGREAREEARRKKYGGNRKKYNAEDQPWIIKTSEKSNRKYRGVKEGGVSENASYYIFTQAVDGAFEVYPVNHWYNFTPIQRYKCLTAEEAEEQFGRRNKIYNYFSVMVRKRLQGDEDGDGGDKEASSPNSMSKGKASSGLKVSEMEDWDDSDNDDSDDSEKEGEEKKPKAKKKGKSKQKKKKKDSDAEAEEDSDDGDEEGRELDYISDTSETESEGEKEKKNAEVGVDQEAGLKNLLDSESEEEEKEKESDSKGEESDEGGEKKKSGKSEDGKEKKKKNKKVIPKPTANQPKPMPDISSYMPENLSDDDDDDDKMVDELDSAIESAKLEAGSNSSGNSRDGTPDMDLSPGGAKRKATSDLISGIINPTKKAKIEISPSLVQSALVDGITEEAVRRYLLRKPMTVTELLQKFKAKKTKMQSHDMVNVIAHLLKKINPIKKMQNHKMYLYLNKQS